MLAEIGSPSLSRALALAAALLAVVPLAGWLLYLAGRAALRRLRRR